MVVKSKDYLFSCSQKTAEISCWLNTARLLEKSFWTRAAFWGLLSLTELQALTQSFKWFSIAACIYLTKLSTMYPEDISDNLKLGSIEFVSVNQ